MGLLDQLSPWGLGGALLGQGRHSRRPPMDDDELVAPPPPPGATPLGGAGPLAPTPAPDVAAEDHDMAGRGGGLLGGLGQFGLLGLLGKGGLAGIGDFASKGGLGLGGIGAAKLFKHLFKK